MICHGVTRGEDTIAAIATAPGESGIGIVRISGAEAIDIATRIFRSVTDTPLRDLPDKRMNYGHIYVPDSGEVIDEVLVVAMRAPYTYTREDVIEIHCHGGILSTKKILETVIDEGARIAEPGEFTKRAFLKGRIDLSQAEAVMDIISSKSEMGLKAAMNQLEGRLSRHLERIKQNLLSAMASIEASIDFPEDDIDERTRETLLQDIRKGSDQIEKLLATSAGGRIVREGLRTAIIGTPNVGKSSLLNALLRENRAIVTEVPGTTRDIIEEYVNLKGIPLRVIDTAGIRQTDDLVESIGVEKARKHMADADLVLFMLDAAKPLSRDDRDILDVIRDKKVIVLINKTDLEIRLDLQEITKEFNKWPIIYMSIIEDKGLDVLEDTIIDTVFAGDIKSGDRIMLTRIRHENCLKRARKSLRDAEDAIKSNIPVDLVAIDIKASLEAIGEITGDNITEEIVNKIFEDFCIGK